jgi:hypothetical protein
MRSYICFYRSIGGKNAVNRADLLVIVLVVMLVLVVAVMLLMPLVMVLVIFGFQKKSKGLVDLFMLLPLNPQGLLRKTLRN